MLFISCVVVMFMDALSGTKVIQNVQGGKVSIPELIVWVILGTRSVFVDVSYSERFLR